MSGITITIDENAAQQAKDAAAALMILLNELRGSDFSLLSEKLERGGYRGGTAQDIVNIMNAYVAGSTIINGVTPSSAIPASGNIHTYVAAAGTYTNWNNSVLSANSFGIITRVDGIYSISQTPFDLTNYQKKSDIQSVVDPTNTTNSVNGKAVSDELTKNADVYNITLKVPLTAGTFYTDVTSRSATPVLARKLGLVVNYATSVGVWETQSFIGADISTWTIESSWEKNILTHIISNAEYLMAILDKNNRVLWGIRVDGSVYVPLGIPEEVAAALTSLIGTVTSNRLTNIAEHETITASLTAYVLAETGKQYSKIEMDAKLIDAPKVISNDEYLMALVDKDNKLLWGIKVDGAVYTPLGTPEEVKLALDSLSALVTSNRSTNLTEHDAILATIFTENAKQYSKTEVDAKTIDVPKMVTNAEYIMALVDKDNRLLWGIKIDGSVYTPLGVPEEVKASLLTFSEYIKNTSVVLTEIADIEDRVEIEVDSLGKIFAYRKADGTKVEEAFETKSLNVSGSMKLSATAMTELQKDLVASGFTGGTGDWSDEVNIEVPISRVAAKVNVICDLLPTSKTNDYPAVIQFWDKDGNFFEKNIILNAQGSSSMAYYRKNMSIDLTGKDTIKFGNWVSQDSFHWKAYYIDNLRGQTVAAYHLIEDFYQTKPYGEKKPWDYLYKNTATTINGTGVLRQDIYTGALAHPDGFPFAMYFNGVFYGMHVWSLKKDKANYNMVKGTKENIMLDGVLTGTTLFNGTVDYTQFEIRNPKTLKTTSGATYDGDLPTEIQGDPAVHPLSASVKASIQRLSGARALINSASTTALKRAKFEEFYNVSAFIDYYLHANTIDNFDGFAKNWIWCTWDGLLWAPTVYDCDSIFGMFWKGTFIYPSATTLRGTDSLVPSSLLIALYPTEINARYKELRDAKVISVNHIVSRLEEWVDSVGYENYTKEFAKWNETPSYRASNLNVEFWKVKTDGSTGTTPYSATKTYAIGETCSSGVTTQYTFECIKQSLDNVPFLSIYAQIPQELGFHNSILRIQKWLEVRIPFLDTTFNYTP